jgi:hypothetical protein
MKSEIDNEQNNLCKYLNMIIVISGIIKEFYICKENNN